MSTLKVNDIQEATSGGGKIFPARVWLNFDGTGTISIKSDGNVSSITDVATGRTTANFSNNLADANYAAGSGICNDINFGSIMRAGSSGSTGALFGKTTSAYTFETHANQSGGTSDVNEVSIILVR